MTLNLTIPQTMHTDFTPRITVIGVGGGGTNAVDNMIALNLQGVEFVVANTDAQQLMHSKADRRIQLGPHLTQGLGAGAKPEIGRAAAEEAADELVRHLDGVHMVFITAGMGGGTGTGAAPVIARMARERGILTVGVVTKPFTFEGARRSRAADQGISELQQFVDTLIVIPNQNLFRLANERTGWKEAFKMADHVLYMGVRGVTDLMVAPGLVNLDFADIRTVMAEMGKAMMGTGEAEGENRAIRAAEAAISNPLLEDTNMQGARGLLINITGGDDMTLFEVDQAANRIREEVAEDANIIFGSAVDENLSGRVRVSVVATGIENTMRQEERPRLVAVGGVEPVAAPPAMQASIAGQQGAGQQGAAAPVAGWPGRTTMAPQQAPQAYAPQGQVQPQQQPITMHPQPRAQFADPMQEPAVSLRAAHSPAPNQSYPSAQSYGQQPVQQGPAAPAPNAVPRARAGGLFVPETRETQAPAPQPAAPSAGRSLFRTVTGAARRMLPTQHAETPEQPRAEPGFEQHAEQHSRATPTDEMGLDIPAFLRRQNS